MEIIEITTIFTVLTCIEYQHECTLKWLWSSVWKRRSWK